VAGLIPPLRINANVSNVLLPQDPSRWSSQAIASSRILNFDPPLSFYSPKTLLRAFSNSLARGTQLASTMAAAAVHFRGSGIDQARPPGLLPLLGLEASSPDPCDGLAADSESRSVGALTFFSESLTGAFPFPPPLRFFRIAYLAPGTSRGQSLQQRAYRTLLTVSHIRGHFLL